MTARERISALFDDGSFVELDGLARHRSTAFGLEATRPYGDGVITPAISVLSAVEGVKTIDPGFADWVVPTTAVIIAILFSVQRHGTATVADVCRQVQAGLGFGRVGVGIGTAGIAFGALLGVLFVFLLLRNFLKISAEYFLSDVLFHLQNSI